MIYLFSFQHAVVVKFHRNDCLVRQYRACGIDSLGLGITCILYHCTMYTSRHDLVSFAFYAIPIFPLNFYITCPLSFLITIPDAADHIGTRSIQQCYKQQKKRLRSMYIDAVSYMNAKCTYGSLLTNTVYTKLSHVCSSASLEPHHTFPVQRDK